MKADTVVIVIKGLCYVLLGACAPLGSSLAQWMNSGQWPPGIAWFVIIGAMVAGAAGQLLSFLSSSYGTYTDSRSNTKVVDKAVNVPVDAPVQSAPLIVPKAAEPIPTLIVPKPVTK